MELLTLALFCAILLGCLLAGLPIPLALLAGLVLFLLYGLRKGFALRALLRMAWQGVCSAKTVLLTFLFIGVLTGLWRAAGTIPVLVCGAASLIRPSVFYLMTFLLNCLVSVLTGTAFGTAATMGVVCAAMGSGLGMSVLLTGGAVLSGVFFGDRCSPVSTSALLTAEITGTDLFDNLKNMVKSAALPFAAACLLYGGLGLLASPSGAAPDLEALFGASFELHPLALLPAAVILILSLLRLPVRKAMFWSILAAAGIALTLQHMTLPALLRCALLGYAPADPRLAPMLAGGGIVSMVKVALIVCLSSSYSGIFRRTPLLEGLRGAIARLGRKIGPYGATLLTSAAAAAIACNQTLAILLTHQLCGGLYEEKSRLALDLEDSAVVVSPLIPWSIACSVPLAAVGAGPAAVLLSFYLWLLPLKRLLLRRR